MRAVARRDAVLRVAVGLSGTGEQIEVDVPASGHERMEPGDAVGVRVIGSGVGYPVETATAAGY